jgi:protocatechuate 3,4-dioxygenase beta subunit
MPELGPYGSVRGARGNSRPYRESRRDPVKPTRMTQSGHRAKHRAAHAHFSLAARHHTTEVARADAKVENCSNFQEDHERSRLHSKNKNLLCEM